MSEEKKRIIDEKRRKIENPSCTKYNPKFEYVWKRSLSGPEWKTCTERGFSAAKRSDTPDFCRSHELKIEGKNFIDLKRQTYRPDFVKKKYYSNDNLLIEEIEKIEKQTTTNNRKLKKYNKLQAPDFKKSMTREKLNEIYGDKKGVIPFSMPKYNLVRESKINSNLGPVMLVKYEKMHKKQKKRPTTNERYSDFDVDKILHKVNNHSKPTTPDFKRMISRPDADGPLPVYLKKLFTRQSASIMTENSLKMNMFSEGKFPKTQTSFWPKKSFNKVINLNILTSKKFKESLGIYEKDIVKRDELLNEIKTAMKFYDKNYDDLIKEAHMKKFDNVTYKTFQRQTRIDSGEIEKYLLQHEHQKEAFTNIY